MQRRSFLGVVATGVGTTALGFRARAAVQQGSSRVRREIYLKSPQAGVGVLASSYYTRTSGLELFSRHHTMSRSDTADRAFIRFSTDNGRTWID